MRPCFCNALNCHVAVIRKPTVQCTVCYYHYRWYYLYRRYTPTPTARAQNGRRSRQLRATVVVFTADFARDLEYAQGDGIRRVLSGELEVKSFRRQVGM
jgi:hypothetical protein